MSARRFLICDSFAHAELVDGMICEYFRAEDGNKGSRWAGVSERDDGTFGVEWEDQLSPVFGDDPLLVIDEEVLDGEGEEAVSNWQPVPPPEPEGELP